MAKKPAERKPTNKKKAPRAGTAARQPVASRPVMPAKYGISKSTAGLLDWNWARERLRD